MVASCARLTAAFHVSLLPAAGAKYPRSYAELTLLSVIKLRSRIYTGRDRVQARAFAGRASTWACLCAHHSIAICLLVAGHVLNVWRSRRAADGSILPTSFSVYGEEATSTGRNKLM